MLLLLDYTGPVMGPALQYPKYPGWEWGFISSTASVLKFAQIWALVAPTKQHQKEKNPPFQSSSICSWHKSLLLLFKNPAHLRCLSTSIMYLHKDNGNTCRIHTAAGPKAGKMHPAIVVIQHFPRLRGSHVLLAL